MSVGQTRAMVVPTVAAMAGDHVSVVRAGGCASVLKQPRQPTNLFYCCGSERAAGTAAGKLCG